MDDLIQISDTYKAAYYMTYGAKLVDITVKRIESKKGSLYVNQWICNLEEVPQEAVDNWSQNRAVVNIVDFRRERLRIKKMAKRKML